MSKTAIGLMCKYPLLGKVKTRLAKTIGDINALKVYIELLKNSCDLISGLDNEKYLRAAFISPVDYLSQFEKVHSKFDLYCKQTCDDLGERMREAFRHLLAQEHISQAILIGADCPELTSAIIGKASFLLRDNDIVLGPSEDGGYYLIGLKKDQKELFTGINWSSSTVLEETQNRITALGLKVALLQQLRDVDNEEDMRYFIDNGLLSAEKLNFKGN